MSYGHADKIARNGKESGEKADKPGALPADWYTSPELAQVLTGHDIGTLYRWLNTAGVRQRRIAALTGTTQPQVADIMTGRRTRVQVYDVLVRNAEGLGIPRERMGLSFWGPDGKYYGPPGTYPEEVTVANTPEGVSSAMLRRHLIALGGLIMAGAPVTKVGELLDDLGTLDPVPLPSRLSAMDVARVRDMTRRLAVGDSSFADPEMGAASAALATRLLGVPGPEPVTRALMVAVAELRIEAGWSAFDAGLYRHALHHFTRALELAVQAGDAYCQATALGYAGRATIEHGHPNEGLKMIQAAQVAAWGIPPDDQRAVAIGEHGKAAVEASQLADMATGLALLGEHNAAARTVARGRDLWTPTPADQWGDPDRAAARVEIGRGRLDVAEALAVASLRRWKGGRKICRTMTGIVRATIHVTAGEQRGMQIAHDVITDVGKLTSVRIHRKLVPLAEALEARPGADSKELARMARQVAA